MNSHLTNDDKPQPNPQTKKRDGGGGNRTRVRMHFNKGYYMLSISIGISLQRLPYAGFTLAIPSKSRGLPLKNRQIAEPVSRRSANPTGRRQTERSRFKRLEPILRNRQLCLFRLFNEACGDLGMQPVSHLLPSKPFHPLNSEQELCGQDLSCPIIIPNIVVCTIGLRVYPHPF